MEDDYYIVPDEVEEMINQYIRDTNAEYRESNHANIGSFVDKFNWDFVEKYGAENLDPEDFLVISHEEYLFGEFDHCFKACQEKIEKKFCDKQSHVEPECELSVLIINDILREMLFHPNCSDVIISFLDNVNNNSYYGGVLEKSTANYTINNFHPEKIHTNNLPTNNLHSFLSSMDKASLHNDDIIEEIPKYVRKYPLESSSYTIVNSLETIDGKQVSIFDAKHNSFMCCKLLTYNTESGTISHPYIAKCVLLTIFAFDLMCSGHINDVMTLDNEDLPTIEDIFLHSDYTFSFDFSDNFIEYLRCIKTWNISSSGSLDKNEDDISVNMNRSVLYYFDSFFTTYGAQHNKLVFDQSLHNRYNIMYYISSLLNTSKILSVINRGTRIYLPTLET
ncbi:hypothetical protein C1645_841344 [Glomus cerebriforme]|uniref:Uncharacterized protein n=1 Tax=Glomus cerebriforme TaxID=658196 RepID=A0A397SA23_9GLOM|nr:hypothetical protein C1645_841344 [Glomus cerebriforme]